MRRKPFIQGLMPLGSPRSRRSLADCAAEGYKPGTRLFILAELAMIDYMAATLSGAFFAMILFPALLLALAIPYGIMYLRNGQEGPRDPQIGIKVALYFFFSLSILLVLNGLSVFVVDALVEPRPTFTTSPFDPSIGPAGGTTSSKELRPAQRTAGALVMAGLFFIVIHVALIRSTINDRDWPATRRLFVGWRFAIHGLVVLGAFTTLLAVLFQKNMGDADLRNTLIGILIVWVPSWLVHLLLLQIYSNKGTRSGGASANPFALGSGDVDRSAPPMARLDEPNRD
jgi:hypothetical protein